MNTKYALFALCLPFAFAACQNEEIVKNPSLDLESRGQIDLVVSANYPGMVDSRMSATESNNALSFLWEKDIDVLGAAMMDAITLGNPDNQAVHANYPFVAQNSGASATFASPSSVTKGIYMFYNSYVDVLDRKALKLYLADQEYDPTSSKTSAQQMVNYMNMVSPLVNLNAGITLAGAEEFILPLEFVNLYTPVKVPVVFKNAPEGTKLTKISINSGGNFILGGKIKADVIASAGTLTLKNGAIDSEKLTVADAKEALDEAIQENDLYIAEGTTNVKEGPANLTIKDGVAMTNGVAKEFWILIPRGTYSTLRVDVETSNGKMETKVITVPASIEGNTDAKPQEFTSATRSLSNVEVNFGEGGNVSQPTSFDISNTTEWNSAVQYVLDHITSYVGSTVTFNIPNEKNVYVTSLPEFGFKLTTAGTGKLVLGNADGSAATISLKNGSISANGATIVIGAGATANMTKDIENANIYNSGVLNINVKEVNAKITNNATLNINLPETVLASLTNDNVVKVKADATLAVTTFANIIKLTQGNYVREGVITVEEDASFTLSGNNDATIINNGTLEISGTVNNNRKIDNYGVLEIGSGTFTNAGTIVAQDGSKSDATSFTNTNGIIEVINPETWSVLQNNGSTKYNYSDGKTTAVVSNRKAFLAAKTASMDITLGTGEWSIVEESSTPGDSSRELKKSEFPSTISLKGSLNAKVEADVETALTVSGTTSTITTAKNVVLQINSLNIINGAAATISTGSVLSIDGNANVIVAGTLTNNGVLDTPAIDNASDIASLSKLNITVGTTGTLTNAKGATIGGKQNTQAIVTVTGNITNNGTIWGSLDTSAALNAKRGTVKALAAIKTNNTDLSVFAGATSIEATGTSVATIPVGTNIKFTGSTPAIVLVAGTEAVQNTYGTLTFAGSATAPTITGAQYATVSINFAIEGVTLTSTDLVARGISGKQATLSGEIKDTSATPKTWGWDAGTSSYKAN